MDAAGKQARDARRDSLNLFATVLAARHREIRAVDPWLAPIPDRVYLAIAFAVRELIRDELETQRGRRPRPRSATTSPSSRRRSSKALPRCQRRGQSPPPRSAAIDCGDRHPRSQDRDHRGGFGGIGAAIELQSHGFGEITLLDRAPELGGTWLYNSYPGAACDVPSHLYSYSFAQRRDWRRLCSPQAEILDYLRSVAHDYGVDRRPRPASR